MNKIRIGNDIRLLMTIEQNVDPNSTHAGSFNQSSIKQLRCYLVNTSFAKRIQPDDLTKFKRVGFPQFYQPTEHNINNSGYPSYYMMPANVHNYDTFSPDFHDYHWWPGFRGFGINPEPFNHYRPHRHDHKFDNVYLAESQVLPEENRISCLFPAVDQLMCGTYKLIVVLSVYEQGWGKHNLRTYTIDKGNIFELVDDHTGKSGNITIDVDGTGDRENLIKSIFANKDTDPSSPDKDVFYLPTNSSLRLGLNDIKGKPYNIFCILKDDCEVVYNPYDWNFNQLEFSIENGKEDILTVDKLGVLTSHDVLGVEDRVTVTVSCVDDPSINYQFVVAVQNLDTILLGFDDEENVQNMYPTSRTIYKYSIDNIVIDNTSSENYLWIFSQRKVDGVSRTVIDTSHTIPITSEVNIPLQDYGVRDGYYCYRSVDKVGAGDVRLNVEFNTSLYNYFGY